MNTSIHFKKGSYVIQVNSERSVSIERCRFHLIGKLLRLFGWTQEVTINGKKAYIYLKGKEAFLARIKSGRGKDLEKLVLGKQKVSYTCHRLLRSLYPDLTSKVKHGKSGNTYIYSPFQIHTALNTRKELSLKELETQLLSRFPSSEETPPRPTVSDLFLFYRIQGATRYIFPLTRPIPSLSSQDLIFYCSKDVLTGKKFMIKHGITAEGNAGVEADYSISQKLGDHPGLLKILYLSKNAFGTAHISPFYEKGDLAEAKNLTDRQKEQGLIDLLRSVAYIHSKNTYHGDIKPENVLLGDQWVLNDFETVGALCPDALDDFRHTKTFFSNEDKKTYPKQKSNIVWHQKRDIASLALLILSIYKVKMSEYPSLKAMQKQLKNVPEKLRPVLEKMLNIDYEQRISAEEALKSLTSTH